MRYFAIATPDPWPPIDVLTLSPELPQMSISAHGFIL